MVCRIFQKSSGIKKQQQTSSSHPSLDSPCETNSIVNEFGDIELPNLNSNIASSSGISNLSPQSHHNNGDNNSGAMNVMMNLNMNWGSAAGTSANSSTLLPWHSNNLLSSNYPSMNSLLLKALQLRSTYQQRDNPDVVNNFSLVSQGNISHFGNDLTSNYQASASRAVDSSAMSQPHQPDQSFNLDSIW